MINKLFRLVRSLFSIFFLLFILNSTAQTPGVIFEGLPNSVLDPNGDGYVSLPPSETPSQYVNTGFPANVNATDNFDVLYSEINYVGITEVIPEPTGDLTKGPDCGFTDLVQDADSRSTYYYTDGTNMLFRFRLGDAKSNSKGYSILIDTDEKFGFSGPNADPNAVVGNPGFEIEIVLRTNFEVNAFNIDGTTEPGTAIATRPYATHAIKSLALTTVCNDPDYFYDFYLPFTDIAGIDSTTKLRMVSMTSIAPKSATGTNGVSDIAGIDDSTGTIDSLVEEIIAIQTPTNGAPIERTDCPLITGGNSLGFILDGDTQVTGTLTGEAVGSIIQVFINGIAHGSTTVTLTGGAWTQTGLTLSDTDVITATATATEKGTSEGNCDTEIVVLSACIPLATPSFASFDNGGKTLSLTYAAGTPAGTNFIVNFYDASTGSQITTIQGVNVIDYATTSATAIGLGGGNKFTNETLNFIVTIDTNPSTCESLSSEPISTCTTGSASVTPFLDPIETGDTSITGNFGGIPPTDATLRLIINGSSTSLTTSTTGSSNLFSFDITNLTIADTDVITVSNRDFGTACISTLSAAAIILSPTLKPSLNGDYCADGNLTSVSGVSSEIGGSIRLYTNVSTGVNAIPGNLETPTAIVSANGNWTITGLNIAPDTFMVATAQGIGKTESVISDEVQITAKTTGITLAITSDPIREGDLSITGTSTGLPTGSTIQLYLDNAIIDGYTATTDASGNWTITGLDTPFNILYTDAVVTVTGTETLKCESDQSASKVVACLPPATPSITASTLNLCEKSTFIVTIDTALPGVAYQLYDQNNNIVGPTIIGPSVAASVDIETDPIVFGTTSVTVKAFKFGVNCTVVESNSIALTVDQTPTITFDTNPSATFSVGAQTANLSYSATTNSPDQYKIDFDDVSFTDIPFTSLPASPIIIDIPAGLAVGVYTATVTIQEPVIDCQNSYPITITIVDATTPTITFTNTNDNLCAGTTSANFIYSATTNSPTLYSINFNDTANLQGFTDIVNATLPASPITITVPTNPNGDIYNGVISISDGTKVSVEYPITINIRKPNPGIISGNQVVNSGIDVAAFISVEDGTENLATITYQWQSSTTSATTGFSDILGATSSTYDEGTLTQTTYYKRIVNSDIAGDICSSESEVITVNVTNLGGIPMITQIYQVGTEKWIEITNISSTTAISPNLINIQLYTDKTVLDQTDVLPDETYTVTSALAAGQSILIRNTANNITNFDNSIPANVIDNDALTSFNGGNDIITLSTTTDITSWANRYDVITSIENNSSYVRKDEILTSNTTYTPSEWVIFIDNSLSTEFNNFARHPHAPLISEIANSNTNSNTKLGLHNIGSTKTTGINTWGNGFPDRSRYAIVDQNYTHENVRLSARKLEVQGTSILSLDSQLLVVTNNVNIADNAEIRLLGSSQLMQSHTGTADISGNGKIYIDQDSDIASVYRYNYISSPVTTVGTSTYTIGSIFKDGTTPITSNGIVGQNAGNIAKNINFITGLDGSVGTPLNISTRWLYTFASNDGINSSWIKQGENTPIPTTDGFIFKGPGVAQNYTFVGNPNDGQFTTTIGANDAYLVGNPFPSALNALKFINDNLASIDGTLYFWDHVNEEDTTSITSGHNYAGYIGGYATINLSMGVAALKPVPNGAYSITSQAENSTTNGTQLNDDGILAIELNQIGEFIEFDPLSEPSDIITIRYRSSAVNSLLLKKDGNIIGTYQLPATGISYNNFVVNECFENGEVVRLETTGSATIFIDNINISDNDGNVSCSPGAGIGESYKTPGTHVPVGQGFFISGSETGGSIIFNNSQREFITKGVNSVFFKTNKAKSTKAKSDNKPLLKLGMTYLNNNDGVNYNRQIGISFSDAYSFKFDKGFDSKINDLSETDIYWKFPNNESLYVISAIQAITDDLEVPLEITMGHSGDIGIKIDEIKNITRNVFITDKLTGISYDIINESAILTLDQGLYTDRFVLTFKPKVSLSLENEISKGFTNIYVDNKNKELVISKEPEITINEIQLFSILGTKVETWKIKDQKDKLGLTIDSKINTGFYIVKLNSNKGVITKKVIIE
ncbi:T9SS type A sorting domain-containing protein [uncultured Polaribacter sp.]|uniref:T9SS type A sorting domain-containing protein n=1 Tax=uncultured Polaribacter sp. TaxID=174711 RepID=UPI00260BBF6D|nr:T9SS type A sorting domain-containing protein [uncultured Polaribacter sp.]